MTEEAGTSVLRAALPSQTHEWVVVPENDPNAWSAYQAVRDLPITGGTWSPIPLEVVNPIDGKPALRATMPWWSGTSNALVLRDEAIEVIGPLLAPHGRLLTARGVNARLELFTAPLLDDALVEMDSEFEQSPGSSVVRLRWAAFASSVLGQRQAFVVLIGSGYHLFLCEGLVRKIEETGLTTGVRFEVVGQIR